MIFAAYILFAFFLLRVMVVLANYITQPVLPDDSSGDEPLVSVLIPARNEEGNISRILNDLLNNHYKNIEVWVCNDQSEDNTAFVLQEFARRDVRIRYFNGQPLPENWLGKNWACHQLAAKARGDYLLFLDADVRLKPVGITNSISWLRKHKLDFLSLFPVQIMKSWGEWASVPLMNVILLSFLPLKLTRFSRNPSFSAANGQFMLFEQKVYNKNAFHKSVKSNKVEDIEIMKVAKRKGLRSETMLSNGSVQCRMYTGLWAAARGFSKNVKTFFGDSLLFMMLYLFVHIAGFAFILLYLPVCFAIMYVILFISMRALIAHLSRQSIWKNILFAIAHQLSFVIFVYLSVRNSLTKKYIWKGRVIS